MPNPHFPKRKRKLRPWRLAMSFISEIGINLQVFLSGKEIAQSIKTFVGGFKILKTCLFLSVYLRLERHGSALLSEITCSKGKKMSDILTSVNLSTRCKRLLT